MPPTAALDVDTLPTFDVGNFPGLSPAPQSDVGSDDSDDGDLNDDLGNNAMLPPDTRRPAGRPKKKRVRNAIENEKQKILHCTRCTGEGHNRRTCKEPVRYQKPHA